MTKREWRITHNTVPGEFVTHTKIRDKDDTVIATLHADDEVNGPLIIRAVNAHDELVAIAERVKFQKHAIRGALIASGHTSALEFFDATLALIESTVAKGERRLSPDWCPQPGDKPCEFASYPGDGECSCGTWKHHVHCQHGWIIQVG